MKIIVDKDNIDITQEISHSTDYSFSWKLTTDYCSLIVRSNQGIVWYHDFKIDEFIRCYIDSSEPLLRKLTQVAFILRLLNKN
jgi:hypothetical protein